MSIGTIMKKKPEMLKFVSDHLKIYTSMQLKNYLF